MQRINSTIHIAVIDDYQDDLRIFETMFKRWNTSNKGSTSLSCFSSASSFFKHTESFDLVIVDMKMGNISGLDVFKWLIRRGTMMPVILMTSGSFSKECYFDVALDKNNLSVESILGKYTLLKGDRMGNAFQFNVCAANYIGA